MNTKSSSNLNKLKLYELEHNKLYNELVWYALQDFI